MDFEFSLPDFQKTTFAVRVAGALHPPGLLADGKLQRPTKGTKYAVVDDAGQSHVLALKSSWFDAVPGVQLDGRKRQRIAPPLAWYEYLWSALPITLLFVGGAVGGLCGGLALAVNTRVFRTREGFLARYGVSAAASLAAVVVYLLVASLVGLFLHR